MSVKESQLAERGTRSEGARVNQWRQLSRIPPLQRDGKRTLGTDVAEIDSTAILRRISAPISNRADGAMGRYMRFFSAGRCAEIEPSAAIPIRTGASTTAGVAGFVPQAASAPTHRRIT